MMSLLTNPADNLSIEAPTKTDSPVAAPFTGASFPRRSDLDSRLLSELKPAATVLFAASRQLGVD
jgi:hypothetical protein